MVTALCPQQSRRIFWVTSNPSLLHHMNQQSNQMKQHVHSVRLPSAPVLHPCYVEHRLLTSCVTWRAWNLASVPSGANDLRSLVLHTYISPAFKEEYFYSLKLVQWLDRHALVLAVVTPVVASSFRCHLLWRADVLPLQASADDHRFQLQPWFERPPQGPRYYVGQAAQKFAAARHPARLDDVTVGRVTSTRWRHKAGLFVRLAPEHFDGLGQKQRWGDYLTKVSDLPVGRSCLVIVRRR